MTGQVIEPMVYGHSSGLSPFAVVVSTIVWGFLWGPVGLVVATPLTICLVVLGRHFPRLEFIEIMLGDEPPLQPHELFYQRMLAGDPAEAVAQARELLKARAVSTYYDEIAMEAVRRAHLDVVNGAVSGERLEVLAKSTDKLIAAVERIKISPPLLGRRSLEARAALQRIRPDRTDARLVVEKGQLPPNWRQEHPVAVLHGADPLDSTAAAMLAQVLTKHGLAARVMALEAAAKLGPNERDFALVCLSFVEPLSTLHLRASGAAVRRGAPQAKVMLCLWQRTSDGSLAAYAEKLRVDAIVTTISDALDAAFDFCLSDRKRRVEIRTRQQRRRRRDDAAAVKMAAS